MLPDNLFLASVLQGTTAGGFQVQPHPLVLLGHPRVRTGLQQSPLRPVTEVALCMLVSMVQHIPVSDS
jgi:hypothetical protein